MRPTLVLATVSLAALLAASSAGAQQPGMGGGAAAPEAGGVPTLQQQPTGEIPQAGSDEPKRAPGSKADGGVAMPLATPNSGTTETFAETPAGNDVPWPCAQRKVPTISAGTLWSGPDLAQGKDWDQDRTVSELAQKLASRRLPIDEVDPLVDAFAKQAGADKDKKLTQLFTGVLDIINGNRDQILQGIMRYARGQERLAERLRAESDKISEQEADVQGPTGISATEKNKDFAWDQRIFKERRQALTYVCETPSLLERRAYEIARRIQAQL